MPIRAQVRDVWKCLAAVFLTLLTVMPAVAYGQTVTAMWDPSPASDDVTGYQVCIGTKSRSCNVQLAWVSADDTSFTFSPKGGVLHHVGVRALNRKGASPYSSEATFSVPAFTPPGHLRKAVGVAISPVTLSVSDPDGGALTFSHTGLPIGLTLNEKSGRITGTPAAAGTYNVTVFVSDGLVSVSRSFPLTVTDGSDELAPALTIESQASRQTVTTSSVTIRGTATDNRRGGSGIARVTVNGRSADGGRAAGNGTANWSRTIQLSSGINTITVEADDGAGNTQMQQLTLRHSPSKSSSGPLKITAVSVTPGSGSGSSQTFTLQYTDSRGATNLFSAWVWFSGGSGACLAYHQRATNTLYLLNDKGTAWLSRRLGSSGTLQNNSCAISTGSSSASVNGSVLTLKLAVTFTPAFSGTKTVQMFANAAEGRSSGWQTRGSWTVPKGSTPPPKSAPRPKSSPPARPARPAGPAPSAVQPGVQAVSVTPGSGSGRSQTLTLKYTDSRGATNLFSAWVWFSGGSGACMAYHQRATNTLYLLNDAGTAWLSRSLGSSGTLQNNSCAISTGSSSASVNGSVLTLNLAVTFKSAFSGTKSVQMFANATEGLSTGWQTRGRWIVP